jgi:plasmid stabilization system protein ParE
MRVEFSPEAKAEFEDSEDYYERQVPGLGDRFRVDIRDALARLRRWPFLGQWRERGVTSGA